MRHTQVGTTAWITWTSWQAWTWSTRLSVEEAVKPPRVWRQAVRSESFSQFFLASESWPWPQPRQLLLLVPQERPQLLRVMAPPNRRSALTDLTDGRQRWSCPPGPTLKRGSAQSEYERLRTCIHPQADVRMGLSKVCKRIQVAGLISRRFLV